MILYILIPTLAAVNTALRALTETFTSDMTQRISDVLSEVSNEVGNRTTLFIVINYIQTDLNETVPSAVSDIITYLLNDTASIQAAVNMAAAYSEPVRQLKGISDFALGVLDAYLSLPLVLGQPITIEGNHLQSKVLNTVSIFTKALFLCELIENQPYKGDLWRDTLVTLRLISSPLDVAISMAAATARVWQFVLTQNSTLEERQEIPFHGAPLIRCLELLQLAKRYFETTLAASRGLGIDRGNRSAIADLWRGVSVILNDLIARLHRDLASVMIFHNEADVSVVTASLNEIIIRTENLETQLENIKLFIKRVAIERTLDDFLESVRLDQDAPDIECAICQEETGHDFRVKLQCSHEFHAKCLKEWLIRNQTCPLCRASVRSAPSADGTPHV